MAADANVLRLARLHAVSELAAGMEQEQAAYVRAMEADHRLIYGGEDGGEPVAGDDPMKITAAGNVSVTFTQPAPVPQTATQPQPKPALSSLAKAAIAAALVASGVGAGAAIPLAISALNGPAEIVREVETQTKTETVTDWRDYRIGEIVIEGPQ